MCLCVCVCLSLSLSLSLSLFSFLPSFSVSIINSFMLSSIYYSLFFFFYFYFLLLVLLLVFLHPVLPPPDPSCPPPPTPPLPFQFPQAPWNTQIMERVGRRGTGWRLKGVESFCFVGLSYILSWQLLCCVRFSVSLLHLHRSLVS